MNCLLLLCLYSLSPLVLGKGSMLQCGEDIVVGRGNKKAVKFWSSDDELMKVEVIPERNFHNDASGILNIFRKPMFPQGHAKKKDDVVPTSHQSNISIAALSEDNHQIVGAATRPAHFRITDDLSHYSKYIAPVIREEPIFMKDKQTREDQILMRNKQTREDQILMQNKQTRKDQILMQDKQTREDQILLQDKQTREDQILMQDKRTREDQILMQDKQTREDQILKQDKRNREDQILMQDKRTREDPILMQNKPIELQENSNSVLKISGTNLTKEAEETYETIIPSNAKEHDPFTNEDKNDHSLSADTSKKLTNFQDGPENFHTDSKDKLEFKKVNINISDSDQEAETMVDIKASNSAAESHIIKNASSDFSERIIKSSDSHHPQSFILQNGNPIDFEKLMSDKQTFINEDSKRQNLEAEQDHKVENDVSKVQIQNYATSVENYNKIKVEGIEESSHMKLDKHDADLEQIAGSQIIIPLSIVKNTYNLKSQNSDAKETLEYVSKEIINSQEKLDEDIDKTYERETVRDDLENSSVEIDSTTFDKINNSKIGFAWQNMENISPKFTEILLKLEKMPLNSVDLTNKISQPIEIYPEDIGYIENQSDPTHVNIDILKNIVNQVSVKQQGLGIKDEYVSNPVILSEPEVIDTFDKDKAVATSDNTKEVLNVIGFVQNNDQKQKNSHVKSEDISMPETAIEESKLQKNDCIIVKPAVIEDKSADIVPNSNVGRNPSISVDKKLENALNKTEEILYHNNSNRYSNNINRPIYPEETRPTPSVKNEVSDDQDNSQTENLKSNYKEIPIPVSFIHKTDEAGISDNILTTDNDPLKDLDGKLRNQESDNKATNILQSQDTNVVKIINENNIFSKETGSDNALSLLLHGDSKLLKPLEENSQYSIPIPFLYKLRDNLNAGNENPVVIKEPGSKVVIITPQSNTQSDLYKVNEVIALDNIAPKVVMPEDGTKLPSYNEKKEEIEIKSSKHEIDTTTEKDDAEDKLLLSLDESQAKVTQDGKKDNFITLLEKYVISDSKLDSKLPEAISNEAELDKKHNKHVNRKIDDEVSAISYEGGGTNFNEGETAFNFMRRPNDIYKLNQPNLSNLLQTRKGYVDHSEHGSNSLAEGGIQALRDELQHPHGGDSPFFIKLPGSPNAVPVFLQYEPVKIKYIDTENLENTESNLHPGESPSHHFQIDDPNEDGLQFELLHSEAYSFDSKPESNIRKHPDPFFYMDAPNLGNNDDSSKVTMQQTKLDPQLKDDSFLVNLKSKLNFERKDPLSSLDANNEVIYPGRYFTKKPDNSYSSSNIAALTNPVFSLGSKLKIPYVTPSNPQYTPFPLTTNPPSHVEDNNLPIKVNGSRLEVTTEFAVSLDTDQQLKESPNIDFLPAPSINFDDSFDGVAYPDLPISERLKDESVYREENHKKGGSNEISQTEFKDDLYNSAGAGLPPKEDDFDIVALANVLHKNQKIWSNSEIPPIHDSGSWRGPSWNTIKYSVENSENGWDHALGDSPWLETSGREYTAFYSPEEFPGLDPLYFSYKRVPKHIREPRKFELSNVSRLKQFIERLPPRLKTAVIGDGANFRRHKRSAKFGGKVYCEWNFRTEPGLYLLVTFHNLSAPFTVDCYGAYIEVERESNGYGARWCGNRSILNGSRHHVIFAKHKVRISVYDNGDITKTQVTGFEAEIEAIDLFDTEDYNTFLRTKANEKIRRLIEG